MNTNRDFERITEAWLADGPTQLADRVLDAALDEVHLTRQRRRLPVPWRFHTMSLQIRLAAAAVVGALLVGVIYLNLPGRGDVGGPSSTPGPTATAQPSLTINTATWLAFSSTRHGYDIRYPSDWQAIAAKSPLTFELLSTHEFLRGGDSRISLMFNDPIYDSFGRFGSSGGYPWVAAASTPIPDGMSEDQWLAVYGRPYLEEREDCVPPRDEWEPVSVDGVPSGMYVSCGGIEAATFVFGRVYTFTVVVGMSGIREERDRNLLRAFLSTVELHPELADDTP